MKSLFFLLAIILTSTKVFSQNLNQLAETIIEKYDIPQMSFSVLTKDSILIIQSVGYKKIGSQIEHEKGGISDFFHLGSNTKAITGFIAAYLVEKNKINWETKFFDLFPKLKSDQNKEYHHITLKDLLTHRAKMQAFTDGKEFETLPKFIGNAQAQRQKFVESVLTLPKVDNDDAYHYSNAGYSAASMMLEKVSGKSWEELVHKVFTKELKLTYAMGWPNRNFENQPWGHWEENGKLVPVSPQTDYNLNLVQPGGDMSMNIVDYSKFIQLNLKGLSGGNAVLKTKTYQFLHNAENEYAIGWGNGEKDNIKYSAHAGTDGSFYSFALIDRNNLIAYIILVNSGDESAQRGVSEMITILEKVYSR